MTIIDKDYFIPHGILKGLQALFGLVIMALISSGRQVYTTVEIYFFHLRSIRPETRSWGVINHDYYNALLFTLVATIILLILTIVLFLCFVFKAYDKILVKQTWRVIDFAFGCLATLLYFIIFMVLAVYCAHSKQERLNTNGPLVGACVLALFTTALYAFAAYKMADTLRKTVTTSSTPTTANT